jgi:hypothetical protein
MPGVSTAQLRALRAVRQANSEGRGLTPPSGPTSRPFTFLKNAELLEDRRLANAPCYWLTEAGVAAIARVEGSVPPAPVIVAYPVITTFVELRAAIRNGFELVQQPPTFKFALKRGDQFSTSEKLQQIAEDASRSEWVMFSCPLQDGSRLYKLTTRAP